MTGKDMLQGIQNLDAELIEESEFGTFGKRKARHNQRSKHGTGKQQRSKCKCTRSKPKP